MYLRLLALTLAPVLFWPLAAAEAKTPGKTYCFNGTCHYVKTLDETRRLIGVTTTVKTSFYDDPKKDSYNPSNLTSSGEYFRAWKADNAASPIYPNGTKLLVWHPGTRKALTVRVNNAGPYWGDRKLDLSRAAAEALGMGGVATLQVRVLEAPTKAEATYSKGRTYAPVKGYMGQYASLDSAFGAAGSSGSTRLASIETPVKAAAAKVAATATKVAEPVKVAAAITPKEAPAKKPAPAKVAAASSSVDEAASFSPALNRPNQPKQKPIKVASNDRPPVVARRNALADAVGYATERAERDISSEILHRRDQQ